ncbi:FAD:protein FMN transferase [bacterium]|nr:FAD:protein FMN transferase [bacterium]
MRLRNWYKYLIIVSISMLILSCKEKPEVIQRQFFTADTFFTIKIYESVEGKILDDLQNYIVRLSSDIDRYNKNSFIYKLNDTGKLLDPPQWLYDLLNYSMKMREASSGGFDITIGELVDLWGFGTKNPHIPQKEDIESFLKKARELNISKDRITTKNCKLDLGAIGKGFLLEKAKQFLLKRGVNTFLLNFGGNIYGHGERTYKIGVQVPYEPTGVYDKIVEIKDQSVATSGDYQRYFEKNGKRYCHIFDPKTGYQPTLYNGITVITKDPIDSDALSTAVFVKGILPVFKSKLIKAYYYKYGKKEISEER